MNGWLSPRGEFYECDLAGHLDLARELNMTVNNPEYLLERFHWIKVSICGLFLTGDTVLNYKESMSQEQLNFIWDLYRTKKDEISYLLYDHIKELLFDAGIKQNGQ